MAGSLGLLVAVLATWRLSHLVAHEDGPFDLVAKVRHAADFSVWGRLMDCPYCLNLWFAAPFAVWLASNWIDGLALWPAISGGACLIEQISARLISPGGPPVIEPLPPPVTPS